MTLHKLIGSIVKRMEDATTTVLLDKRDCGGEHYIRLYCDAKAAHASWLCEVDAAIVINREVKVIIEIDTTDKPAHLCGKLFASTLAIQAKAGKKSFQMADSVSFIQVLAKPKNDKTSKDRQWSYLQIKFQKNLDEASEGKIRHYQIFYEKESGDFDRIESQQELIEHIQEAIAAQPHQSAVSRDARHDKMNERQED
jgi:hypothetical protein